ncbi:hypothetical protein D3C81_1853560 [compost metagenome]
MLLAVGINGVAQQVQQHLLKQYPIGIHRRQLRAHAQLDADLVTGRLPGTQAHGLVDDIQHVQCL